MIKKKRSVLTLFVLSLCFISCNRCCYDYPVVGPDEFVMDSYKIRQGKMSILEMTGVPLQLLPYDPLAEYEDLIVEGDILNLAIWHPTRFDLISTIQNFNEKVGGFLVKNGKVNLPDIPPVYVEGLTLDAARERIQNEFQHHIQDVEVYVSYKDRLTRRVEFTGLTQAATLPVDGKTRLYDLLSKARISPDANLFKSYVVRDNKHLGIDLHRLINKGDMTQNIVMRGGDKVHIAIPNDSVVTLMGEVAVPTAVPLPYGYMPLCEALVAARGIPYTGDRCHIQVIRGALPCPKIYQLSWDHIVQLPNESLLLIPGDTVYVSETPITKWNRFISQMLPSCHGVQALHQTYKIFAD